LRLPQMSTVAAVAELLDFQQSEAEKAAAKYAELVEALDSGADVDRRAALKILKAAGKSPADLQTELSRRRRVAELRQLIADAADWLAERKTLDEQLAAKDAEIKATTARLAGERAAIANEAQAVRDKQYSVENARRELRKLVPLPAEEAA